MFIANTEKVHYYPSIGQSDNKKTVSCCVNAQTSFCLFEETKKTVGSAESSQNNQVTTKK